MMDDIKNKKMFRFKLLIYIDEENVLKDFLSCFRVKSNAYLKIYICTLSFNKEV